MKHRAVPGSKTIGVCNPRSYHEKLGSSVCFMVDAEINSFLSMRFYFLGLPLIVALFYGREDKQGVFAMVMG